MLKAIREQTETVVKNTPPTQKTVIGGGIGASVAVLVVTLLEMFDIPNLTPERVALFTGALSTVCSYLMHQREVRVCPPVPVHPSSPPVE